MEEKLSWTELRRALAARAGVSEKQAGAFLNAMQAQLVEALKSDKQVKINGLGTFKLQAVAPRKSVNVTTGEEILIEGYNKLAFTPEAGVKELIESGKAESSKPAAASVPTDPILKLGAQAEEIVDILGELGQSPAEAPEEPKAPEMPEPEPVFIPEPEPKPEPVFIPEPGFVREPEPMPEPPKKKKSHFLRDTLICVVILLMLLAGGYFFLRNELTTIIMSFLKPDETEIVVPVAADTIAVAMPEEEVIVEEPIESAPEVEEVASEPKPESKPKAKAKKKNALTEDQILKEFLEASGELAGPTAEYPDLITTEPMHQDSRLTWMSKRFYGTKAYWPYLYDANKDIISNPNDIEVGTPIRVPRLTEAQRDTTSAEFARIKQEAEAACMK
jgi:nucleoid DNA-binding protein